MGLQRPADRDDDARGRGPRGSLSELPEARVVRTPGAPREVLDSDAGRPARRGRAGRSPLSLGAASSIPSGIIALGAYRRHGAVVRARRLPPGAGDWVDA